MISCLLSDRWWPARFWHSQRKLSFTTAQYCHIWVCAHYEGLCSEITRRQGGRRCSVDGNCQAEINARDRRGLSWPTPDWSLFPQTFPAGRVVAFGLWVKRTSPLNFGAGEKLNASVSLRDWTLDRPSVRLCEGQQQTGQAGLSPHKPTNALYGIFLIPIILPPFTEMWLFSPSCSFYFVWTSNK